VKAGTAAISYVGLAERKTMLPDDLKNLGDDDPWQLIPPEMAGALLGCAVVVCLILDRLI
jgi:hypothetical protein